MECTFLRDVNGTLKKESVKLMVQRLKVSFGEAKYGEKGLEWYCHCFCCAVPSDLKVFSLDRSYSPLFFPRLKLRQD